MKEKNSALGLSNRNIRSLIKKRLSANKQELDLGTCFKTEKSVRRIGLKF